MVSRARRAVEWAEAGEDRRGTTKSVRIAPLTTGATHPVRHHRQVRTAEDLVVSVVIEAVIEAVTEIGVTDSNFCFFNLSFD